MWIIVVMAVLLAVGLVLTVRWGGAAYIPWPGDRSRVVEMVSPESVPPADDERPSLKDAALCYLRGVGVALVGGFWAGALVTGPAMRLIMRLLAVTAGDDAQGRITEANEVIGQIELGGTLGLVVFGGILPGLLSGGLYLVVRRWLPAGRAGGVVFGLLHLVVGATRVDPLRADNIDFELVGPAWLAVLTFGVAAIVHGMAVVAIANRFSATFPAAADDRAARTRAALPLVLPALFLIPGIGFAGPPIALGFLFTLAVTRLRNASSIVRSRGVLIAGRVALAGLALVALPTAVRDLVHIVRGA